MEEHAYINPKNMPEPNGPYQYGLVTNGWLHIAGQLPIDPDKPGEPIPEGIKKQTEAVFKNIWRILGQAGYGPEDVVHVRNFLTDLSRDMQGFNEIYSPQFPVGHHPPRTTVGVSQLAKGALIEIDLVAYKQPQ
jgi:reactive intermediate/imine deaminase